MTAPPSTTKLRHALLGVVRRAYARSGWSCRELARRSGLTHPTVLRVLRGRQLAFGSLEALLTALGVHDALVRVIYAARDELGVLLVLPADQAPPAEETP